ncbi:MAG: H-NS histone family protein [Aquabacterium sp.]|nr:MAG: H-NS histone family protein [Aquabacterium sp.]
MSKSYQDIQKQIEALKREAEKLKRKEIEGVIDRIKEAIVTYELTAADLGLTGVRGKRGPAGKKRGAKATRAKAGGAVKFRDAEGNTWGGRGPRPLWLREALAGGKQLQDFAV